MPLSLLRGANTTISTAPRGSLRLYDAIIKPYKSRLVDAAASAQSPRSEIPLETAKDSFSYSSPAGFELSEISGEVVDVYRWRDGEWSSTPRGQVSASSKLSERVKSARPSYW